MSTLSCVQDVTSITSPPHIVVVLRQHYLCTGCLSPPSHHLHHITSIHYCSVMISLSCIVTSITSPPYIHFGVMT